MLLLRRRCNKDKTELSPRRRSVRTGETAATRRLYVEDKPEEAADGNGGTLQRWWMELEERKKRQF